MKGEVRDIVANKARAAGAAWWLDALPGLVADLEREWSVTVGNRLDEATEAFVAEAVRADGTPAVLKLMVPDDREAPRREIEMLRLAGGDGCAALLEADADRGALLLERLGRSMHQLGLPLRTRHTFLCAAAMKVWRPATPGVFPDGAEKGGWLIDFITDRWDRLDRPCSARAVDHAIAAAARRIAAHDDERSVLVHGDVHEWNALEAGDGFKLVDPDGLLAEPEYDMGILMREDPVELLDGDPRDRAAWLARQTGLDATAIWEWGVVERVSTGLLCVEIELEPIGSAMLHAAEVVAALE